MMTLFCLNLMISLLINSISMIIMKKKKKKMLTPFECGFNPFKKARMPFSNRFFLITIIFLIFDAELMILTPMCFIRDMTKNIDMMLFMSLTILILLAGLIYEWIQGALNWVY